jgi:hypothetical protein
MKYIYTQKLDEYSINEKVQSSYSECVPREPKQLNPKQRFFFGT